MTSATPLVANAALRRLLLAACVLFVLGDLAFSFRQHYAAPLDGDLPEGVLPFAYIEPVLADPLGLTVLLDGATHPNPNRFFGQWALHRYFNTAPRLLRTFASPTDSVYLAAAFAKTLTQGALVGLLATFAAGGVAWRRLDFWVAAALVTPLFQTNGYRGSMGIVDVAPTYVFFYALPTVFLLVYLAPGILAWRRGTSLALRPRYSWCWPLLALPVCLSGPLNPGIVAVVLTLYATHRLYESYSPSAGPARGHWLLHAVASVPREHWVYLAPLGVLAAYSLYIGSFNAFTITQAIPLSERYARLPVGIFKTLTGRPGFLLIFATLLVNYAVLRRRAPTPSVRRSLATAKWLLAFAVLYLLLLPLGGYRPARPYILRYDTMIPITLGLMFALAYTSVLVLRFADTRQLRWYAPVLLAIGIAFTNADRLDADQNAGQRALLAELRAAGAGDTLALSDEATLLSWAPVRSAEESAAVVALLRRWGILGREVRYYQVAPGEAPPSGAVLPGG